MSPLVIQRRTITQVDGRITWGITPLVVRFTFLRYDKVFALSTQFDKIINITFYKYT